MEQILNEDFTSFFIRSQPELVNQKQMYRVFLDGKKSSAKDKIIDIYAITAKGEVNTSSKKETLEMKEDTIYYMITYNEINTSLRILDENVYGEKLIISESNDLTKETPVSYTHLCKTAYHRYQKQPGCKCDSAAGSRMHRNVHFFCCYKPFMVSCHTAIYCS